MNKGICFILALVALWAPIGAKAAAPALADAVDSAMAGYDLSAWQEIYSSLPASVKALWGYDSIAALMRDLALGDVAKGQELFSGIWSSLLQALRQGMGSLASIWGLALLCGLLEALLGEGQGGIKQMASFLLYGMCAALLSGIMTAQLALATDAISSLCRLLEAISPLLVTLLAAMGANVSAGIAQPVFILLSGTVAKTVQTALLPAVLCAGVLYIVGAVAGRPQLSHLAGTLKSFIKWAMGGITTVFLGSMSIKGMSAGSVDSISLRTMRYTLDKSLPLVGGVVSGSLDTVRGCALLLKNAAGMAAALLALGVVLIPLLQLIGMSLSFRLTGALTAQLGEDRLAALLQNLADICRYLFACVALVVLMYVLTMGLVVALGGG